ncbi:MAG: hypothetical protein ABIG61_00310 [Planctomycetota bacterium]
MLRRFFDYTDKVFDFSKALSEITDTRSKPQINTQSVLMSSFIMHLTRLGSLNALDTELRLPKRIENFIGKDKPSVDTIGRVFAKIVPAQLRAVLWDNCYQLKRNKALDTNLPLNAVGIDGHEFFSH